MPLSVQYHRMPQAALGCPRLPQAALGCPRLPQAAPPRSDVETSTMQRGDCEVCVRIMNQPRRGLGHLLPSCTRYA